MSSTVNNLWLIPAVPLLAAAILAVTKQRHRRFSAFLAIAAMAIAFLISGAAFLSTLGEPGEEGVWREVKNFAWFQIGKSSVQLGWILDPLTASMLVMVTFVGLLIFIYSIGYMAHDSNSTRFFGFLSLFAAAMLGLVISNSLLLLFICWELVGLASYLLIGFWYHKPSAAAAAKKAFITTRIGDMGLLLGMLWLYSDAGTLLFYDNGNGCLEASALTKLVAQTTVFGMAVSTGISLLIFCGAMGKSGQVPLHVWLPDAMEGPTPVSALIHAATMVAAGVFLIARMYPLMAVQPESPVSAAQVVHAPAPSISQKEGPPRTSRVQGDSEPTPTPPRRGTDKAPLLGGVGMVHDSKPLLKPAPPVPVEESQVEGEAAASQHSAASTSTALQIIAWIGTITAVFAACIAVAQTDIKRILAYSTVSQLGFMMVGLGVGGVAVGMFHLMTHAFFKALLFLGAGSVIHGCGGEQDIRRMGGLTQYMPTTFLTYAAGMMALSGVPVLAGFWSKDDILHAASVWSVSRWPFYLCLFAALLTAFYMTRQVCYVFLGRYRSSDAMSATPSSHGHHLPHESPSVMTIPLMILAFCAVLLGLIGTPAWPWFEGYLNGHHPSLSLGNLFESGTIQMMLISTAIVFIGVGLAWRLYGSRGVESPEGSDILERAGPEVFSVLRNKFYVDELYEATVIRFNAWAGWVCDWFDRWVWTGAVRLISYLVLGFSWLNRLFDEYVINLGFDQGCQQVKNGGQLMSSLQKGQVQLYLRVIGMALTALLLVLTWGIGQ